MTHPSSRSFLSQCRIAAVLLLATVLAACATSTPYQPQDRFGFGYAEQLLETDRYRVSYSGNSSTTRETVETYLLYRAAELTLETGNDYFIVQQQDTERRERIVSTYHPPIYPGFSYSIYGGSYWHRNRLYYQDTARLVDRYDASAIIKVFQGETPEDDVAAYDARDVVRTLETRIVRPAPRPN